MALLIASENDAFRAKDVRRITKKNGNPLPSILLFGYFPNEAPEEIKFKNAAERDAAFDDWIEVMRMAKD